MAILDGTFPLFTVIATNTFARRLGIQIGMTKLQLERFSDLIVRYRSEKQEDSAHHALIDCAHFFTPRVEDTATDTVALDLNGLSQLWGTPRAMAQKLFRAVDKLGLEAHIAIASNPDAAIHAAQAEAGITVIAMGDEAQKLASLGLHTLAASEEIQASFSRWGVQTFQDLARLPEVGVAERLGQEGIRLQQMARGETTRPLRVLNEKLFFKESMEIDGSINSIESLAFIFSRLLNPLCKRLEAHNRATNALRLILTLEPLFGKNPPNKDNKDNKNNDEGDPGKSPHRFVRAIRLPTPTQDSRVLLKLLQLDLDAHRPRGPSSVSLLPQNRSNRAASRTDCSLPWHPNLRSWSLHWPESEPLSETTASAHPACSTHITPIGFASSVSLFRPVEGQEIAYKHLDFDGAAYLQAASGGNRRKARGPIFPDLLLRQIRKGHDRTRTLEFLRGMVARRSLEPGGMGCRSPKWPGPCPVPHLPGPADTPLVCRRDIRLKRGREAKKSLSPQRCKDAKGKHCEPFLL